MGQYENDYTIQEYDKIIEMLPKLKLNIIKMIYESLGINLGKTENEIKYYNYLINDPNSFSHTFGLDASIDFTNYTGNIISVQKLWKIYPNCNKNYAAACILALDKYGDKVGLNNKGKIMVLGQFAHESGSFIYTEEIGKGRGSSYGKITGPYQKAYYGRGPIQITGEKNYKEIAYKYFPYLGIKADIYQDPDLCTRNLEIGCAASLCWFLLPGNGRSAVIAANNGDINNLTKAINGGYNGLEDRIKHTKKIIQATNAGN